MSSFQSSPSCSRLVSCITYHSFVVPLGTSGALFSVRMNKALEDLQAGRDPFAPPPPEDNGDLFFRCAKLSFWVPIGTGVFCAGVANALKGMEGQTVHVTRLILLGVVGVGLVAGIVLAIVGLCGVPKYGASGLVGPALRGLLASGGVLWLTITGFVHGIHNVRALTAATDTVRQFNKDIKKDFLNDNDPQVTLQKAQLGLERVKLAMDSVSQGGSGNSALMAKAFSSHVAKMQALLKDYTGASNGIMEPSVLDMSGVTQRSQLTGRKQLVNKFMSANDKVQDFLAQRPKIFRQDLEQAGVPELERDKAAQGYAQGAAQQDGLLMKIREQDRRTGKALLSMLDLLDANWGKWTYDPNRKTVDFEDPIALGKFRGYLNEVQSAAREQRKLQLQLASMPGVA